MKLSICTISFRHHLISIDEVARWARAQGFQGIELWGPHARHLDREPGYGAEWLRAYGLEVSMLSDYLPFEGAASELRAKVKALSELANRWGARKLRTFAGGIASASATREERRRIAERLRIACDLLPTSNLSLLVETHPRTLADTTDSTLSLLSEVDHPRLRINFDVLHLWEAGDEPTTALAALREYVSHFHLKNIKERAKLGVFSPENVYSPAGSRAGMVPLPDGALDYRTFLANLAGDERVEASLEWFGDDVHDTLRDDLAFIRDLVRGRSAPWPSASGDAATRLSIGGVAKHRQR
jgi:3-dehydroshikimate dehydratase